MSELLTSPILCPVLRKGTKLSNNTLHSGGAYRTDRQDKISIKMRVQTQG